MAELLQQPAEDAEELAAKIIGELDAMRVDRKGYVLVTKEATVASPNGDPVMTFAFGPFPTRLKARDVITKGEVGASTDRAWYLICPLIHPEVARARGAAHPRNRE